MRYARVDLGPEIVFGLSYLIPEGRRLSGDKFDEDHGLDAFESLRPRSNKANGSAMLLREFATVNPGGQKSKVIGGLLYGEPLEVRPGIPWLGMYGGAWSGLKKVTRRTYRAADSGLARSIKALKGKPVQGTVMTQASTQRKR